MPFSKNIFMLSFLVCLILLCSSCSPRITLFRTPAETPLKERLISGRPDSGTPKILLIPLRGFISDYPTSGLLGARPSMVQDVVAQLRLAQKDTNIKAVVLMVNSPGGTITASDILYHEISRYKDASNATVTACFLDIATSGAYYASLAADKIFAHPTSLTGSIGTIMLMPSLDGLMGKIGVEVNAYKSGKLKDMGSLFRKPTPEEQNLFKDIIDDLNSRFLHLAQTHRELTKDQLKEVSSGRVFTARQALQMGLVDKIGYIDDVLASIRKQNNLPSETTIVAYRRAETANDNEYNITTAFDSKPITLMDLGPLSTASKIKAGLYYIWEPALP